MMSRYVQIIPAAPSVMARCYYIDEDGKRLHNGEYWQAPIVCYGLTDRGNIEPLVIDERGVVSYPYIACVDW